MAIAADVSTLGSERDVDRINIASVLEAAFGLRVDADHAARSERDAVLVVLAERERDLALVHEVDLFLTLMPVRSAADSGRHDDGIYAHLLNAKFLAYLAKARAITDCVERSGCESVLMNDLCELFCHGMQSTIAGTMQVQKLSIAIPVLNGGEPFLATLQAIDAQQNNSNVEVELVVVDSGSTDGSLEAARAAGARVVQIDKSEFQHGATRNLAIAESTGDAIALLTDDSTPADENWLDAIVDGFAQADDVALVFGPQRARPEHSPMVARELIDHFRLWGDGERMHTQRIADSPRGRADYERNPGWYVFFSDANGAVARWAWEQIPYREVAYSEDQMIAREMLERGLAKVFHPDAAVIHSHDYTAWQWLQRRFDDFRGSLEILRHRSKIGIRSGTRSLYSLVRGDRRFMRHQGIHGPSLLLWTFRSLRHHWLRMIGEWLGGRADRMPVWLTKRLSLDGRGGFQAAAETSD